MPLITALEKQKRRPRFDLYLEGAFAFSLRPELVLASGLSVGAELTSDRQRWLYDEEQRLGAIEAALRLLAMSQRSEKELRDRLKKRGFRRVALEAAVTRVREMGYLDDAAFAKFFVETRQASTPLRPSSKVRARRDRGVEAWRVSTKNLAKAASSR